jgi:phosphoglycolate phosphatase
MHLLFDLDGTLTDPFPGITGCIQHALVALGRPSPPAESLRWCIGPPLKQIFVKLLDSQDEHLADAAVAKYRERFGSVGLFENSVYAGIEDALDGLKVCGHSLCVATSKPTVYAKRIINHFGLNKYFRSVDGSELDGTRSEKGSLIAHILERDAIAPNDVIMIGDREHDMIGARQNKVAGLGVLWGYGSKEELEAAGAYACVLSPRSLSEIVRKLPNNSPEPPPSDAASPHSLEALPLRRGSALV